MSTPKDVRERCRKANRRLLEGREVCHLSEGPHSDGCGYYDGKYCYLTVDCRTVRGKPLCWISIIDHYTGEVHLSRPCPTTPDAAQYGRAFFTKSGRRPE